MSQTSFKIDAIPESVEGFLALRDTLADTPQGGAAVFVVAMYVYSVDVELGVPLLTIALDSGDLTDGPRGYKDKEPTKRVLRSMQERILDRPYLAASYFQGTSAENGYALPVPPLEIKVLEQDMDKGSGKVFVHCTGADSPRPIQLKKNSRGYWKAASYGSLQVGCRPPAEVAVDDL